jgi:hypothetical protein
MLRELIITGSFGFVVGWAAKAIVSLWLKNKDAIEHGLESIDDRIEKRWHIDIPDSWQAAYNKIVADTVAWVDSYARDPKFWRQLLRNLEPGKAQKLIDELKAMDLESMAEERVGAWIEEHLSPEVKAFFNEEKQRIAEKVATNKIITTLPINVHPKLDELKTSVAAAAVANKVMSEPEEVTGGVFARLIAESEERQKKLAGDTK